MLWKMVPVSFLYDDMCPNNNECRVFFVHDCTYIYTYIHIYTIADKNSIYFTIPSMNVQSHFSFLIWISTTVDNAIVSDIIKYFMRKKEHFTSENKTGFLVNLNLDIRLKHYTKHHKKKHNKILIQSSEKNKTD